MNPHAVLTLKQKTHLKKESPEETIDVKRLNLNTAMVIIFYGIGLGSIYDALQDWLHQDSKRLLLIIEDDLAPLHRFLETEKATQILSDTQVFIQYAPLEQLSSQFSWLFSAICGVNLIYEALPLYKKERASSFQRIKRQFEMEIMYLMNIKINMLRDQVALYHNLYHNLTAWAEAQFLVQFLKRFDQIPALVCGAGPSLTSQLPLLKTLEDRAILFGAGTGLHVLTQNGIQPHLERLSTPTRFKKAG